jgi:hypothetical protein
MEADQGLSLYTLYWHIHCVGLKVSEEGRVPELPATLELALLCTCPRLATLGEYIGSRRFTGRHRVSCEKCEAVDSTYMPYQSGDWCVLALR